MTCNGVRMRVWLWGYGYAVCDPANGQGQEITSFALLFFLKAHLIILGLRTQCPTLGENARDTGWVKDGASPLLSAVTTISYPSRNSSASLRSGPVPLGSE